MSRKRDYKSNDYDASSSEYFADESGRVFKDERTLKQKGVALSRKAKLSKINEREAEEEYNEAIEDFYASKRNK